jgi:hypothetical protein
MENTAAAAAVALTPLNVLQTYHFNTRPISLDADAEDGQISPVSVEPPSVGDGDGDRDGDRDGDGDGDEDAGEMSVSENHHMVNAPRSYTSNRATFGPDTDMAKEWTEHLSANTHLNEDE